MIKKEDIFTKIRAADSGPPAGAYATEIPDKRYVVGNLNSQYEYNQTVDKDNGQGNTGVGSGGGISKLASNIYLEKIASMSTVKSWSKRLYQNVKDAEPLTQVGIAGGMLIGAGKLKNVYDDKVLKKQHSTLEERSLKTLQSINRNLKNVAVIPASDLG
jgi:hypothetical protein